MSTKLEYSKPKKMDDIGRLQVPKHLQDYLGIGEGSEFELTADVKTKTLTFKYIKEKGEDETE